MSYRHISSQQQLALRRSAYLLGHHKRARAGLWEDHSSREGVKSASKRKPLTHSEKLAFVKSGNWFTDGVANFVDGTISVGKSIGNWVAKNPVRTAVYVGGAIAAPFTAGTSLAWATALGGEVGGLVDNAIYSPDHNPFDYGEGVGVGPLAGRSGEDQENLKQDRLEAEAAGNPYGLWDSIKSMAGGDYAGMENHPNYNPETKEIDPNYTGGAGVAAAGAAAGAQAGAGGLQGGTNAAGGVGTAPGSANEGTGKMYERLNQYYNQNPQLQNQGPYGRGNRGYQTPGFSEGGYDDYRGGGGRDGGYYTRPLGHADMPAGQYGHQPGAQRYNQGRSTDGVPYYQTQQGGGGRVPKWQQRGFKNRRQFRDFRRWNRLGRPGPDQPGGGGQPAPTGPVSAAQPNAAPTSPSATSTATATPTSPASAPSGSNLPELKIPNLTDEQLGGVPGAEQVQAHSENVASAGAQQSLRNAVQPGSNLNQMAQQSGNELSGQLGDAFSKYYDDPKYGPRYSDPHGTWSSTTGQKISDKTSPFENPPSANPLQSIGNTIQNTNFSNVPSPIPAGGYAPPIPQNQMNDLNAQIQQMNSDMNSELYTPGGPNVPQLQNANQIQPTPPAVKTAGLAIAKQSSLDRIETLCKNFN